MSGIDKLNAAAIIEVKYLYYYYNIISRKLLNDSELHCKNSVK